MKYVLITSLVVIFIIISFKNCGNKEPEVIKVTAPKVKRDYDLLSIEGLRKELELYDTSKPQTTIKRTKNIFKPNKVILETKLHDRKIKTEIELGQSGNWKIYGSLAVAGAIVGGYIVYKIK